MNFGELRDGDYFVRVYETNSERQLFKKVTPSINGKENTVCISEYCWEDGSSVAFDIKTFMPDQLPVLRIDIGKLGSFDWINNL